MRRVCGILAIVAMAFLCLCGCGKKGDIHPVTDGFTAQTAIRYKDMDIQGQLSCSTDGRVNMVFSLPKSLDGVTLGWNGSEMQMGLGGMTITVSEDSMPDGGLIRCLTRVLAAVSPGGGKSEGADYVITGVSGESSYTLVCDVATGLPKSLSVPEEQLEVIFSEVTVL